MRLDLILIAVMLSFAATALILPFSVSLEIKCARSLRIHCVQQADRDIGIFSRLDTSRVQNLCTEVTNSAASSKCSWRTGGLVNNTRVVIVHTVDICPDLDFGSVHCCSDQRSGVVATTTTLQVVYLTVSIAADETLRNVDFRIRIKIQLSTQFILNIYGVRFCVLIGTHEFQSRKQHGLHTAFLQVKVYHRRRDKLSLCQNHFLFEQSEKVFSIGADVVEVGFDNFKTFLFIFLGCKSSSICCLYFASSLLIISLAPSGFFLYR